MRRIYQAVATQAEKESWSYREFLVLLLAEEVARRKQTRLQRCTRSAHFPFFKTIDEFDFTLQSTLRQSLLGSLIRIVLRAHTQKTRHQFVNDSSFFSQESSR